MLQRRMRRPGASVVECAVVFPLFFLLVISIIVVALGVYRYQEVASLARESARWASVRGYTYQFGTGNNPATPQDVYDNVIKPNAQLLDPSQLTYSVTWNPDNRQWGQVTVTISYQWVPEAFFGGMTLTSTSTMLVSY